MPSQHSQFGASSAARFLACPGAWHAGQEAVEQGLSRKGGGDYADEGTAAHLLAEMCLSSGKTPYDFVGAKITLKHRPDRPFEIDFDFADAVAVFTEHVHMLTDLGYQVQLEQAVEPAWAWTGDFNKTQDPDLPFDLFGTADCVAYHPALYHLVIVDLKFGRGVLVEAKNNAQLRYYGTGALGKLLPKHRVDNVSMRIVQPRARHPKGPVREENLRAEDLVAWARTTLKPGIMRAIEPGGDLIAGEHCRFCPAILTCAEAKNSTRETALTLFRDNPVELTAEEVLAAMEKPKDVLDKEAVKALPLVELDRLYAVAQIAKMAINAIEAEFIDRLESAASEDVNDLLFTKPVATATREQWADDVTLDDATEALNIDTVGKDTVYEILAEIAKADPGEAPPLSVAAKTPKAARRVLKKYGLPLDLLDRFVVTVPGRLTLAPATDPRPVYLPAQADEDLGDAI
jgi:hypothetical protein